MVWLGRSFERYQPQNSEPKRDFDEFEDTGKTPTSVNIVLAPSIIYQNII